MTINHHPILQSIDNSLYNRVLDTVNSIKIHKYLEKDKTFSQKDYDEIQNVIDMFELGIVELWRYAFDKSNLEKKKQFHKICNDCFNLLQVMPVPTSSVEKIQHVLKLFTYSYLGEKWEDMKRFLIENQSVWKINDNNPNWDSRVLSDIYLAILHLIRKEKQDDISDTAKYINRLRADQKEYEQSFLEATPNEYKKSSALELASCYHLAGAVDLLCHYMVNGGSSALTVKSRIDYHFKTAIRYSQNAGIFELDLLLRMLQTTFSKMIENSIWNIAGQINSRATKFIESMTKDAGNKIPVYELLYPQRAAILEQHLLDPALKAIVVNLPTSSGKTIIAEFRILQAINQFHEMGGKVVYVAPTRSLVNQITNRLKRDLGRAPLYIKVEKMSGALEIDSFEENILKSNSFDILVTTPEKLNLLIRHPEKEFAKKIVLAVIDEAHNISNRTRGLNLEMLISNIQRDCQLAHLLLLMTPFVPNHDKVAKWLDPYNPQSISMELDWWQPNDKVVGLYYADKKGDSLATTLFQPLVTYSPTMRLTNEIELGCHSDKKFNLTKVRKSKTDLTVLVASQLQHTKNILILGYTIEHTWSIAEKLYGTVSNTQNNPNLDLVSRYVEAELGESFPLAKYIKKGIGVHNAGLPDDIKELMEWLMEINALSVLVSTTTISQGINFPVNAILLTTLSYPRQGKMPASDFWNLVGRAGRVDQRSVGLIGIAIDQKNSVDARKATQYVKNQTEELVSVLKKMVEDATSLGKKLELRAYANEPEWSSFLQYVSHMYKQTGNLQDFIAEIDINLERTYGFSQLSEKNRTELIKAVKEYAVHLDTRKELAVISDMTGFAPETVENAISAVDKLNLKPSDWKSSKLFSEKSSVLSKLAGIMLNDMPETRDVMSDIKTDGLKITSDALGSIIVDWVSGKGLDEIARRYFGGDNDTKSMGRCVRAIHGKVTSAATWGLAAIQKLPVSGISEEGNAEEHRELSNLSSMIFYGVDSDEAVLMRANHVPRSISKKMGRLYKDSVPEYRQSTPSKVQAWINTLDDKQWGSVVPQTELLSGNEYKKIWQKISGIR